MARLLDWGRSVIVRASELRRLPRLDLGRAARRASPALAAFAGHSHWQNIQHKKGAKDAARAKLFSKLAKEIAVAVRLGGADVATNSRLQSALSRARLAGVPKATVERSLSKDAGVDDLVSQTYEGYGPGGVAFVVEALTDNHKRTVQQLRHMFDKAGGNLGTSGSVMWMFEHVARVQARCTDEAHASEVLDAILEADLDAEIDQADMVVTLDCGFQQIGSVTDAVRKAGADVESVATGRRPTTLTETDDELAMRTVELLSQLEDHDDVHRVYCAADCVPPSFRGGFSEDEEGVEAVE